MTDIPQAFDHRRVSHALQELSEALPTVSSTPPGITPTRARRLMTEIASAIERLSLFSQAIDPVRQPPDIFDPYLPENMGRLVGRTMLEQAAHSLEGLPRFYGAGVYALFYSGPFDAYAPIAGVRTPIYVGKADPEDPLARIPSQQGTRLHARLKDHARSIGRTENLPLTDFTCRYLVIRSGLQAAAEGFLLRHFRPVWNESIMNGFGKHGDSPSTRRNTRAEWDTLHPGRRWATSEGNIPNTLSVDEIKAAIAAHFAEFPPAD